MLCEELVEKKLCTTDEALQSIKYALVSIVDEMVPRSNCALKNTRIGLVSMGAQAHKNGSSA